MLSVVGDAELERMKERNRAEVELLHVSKTKKWKLADNILKHDVLRQVQQRAQSARQCAPAMDEGDEAYAP